MGSYRKIIETKEKKTSTAASRSKRKSLDSTQAKESVFRLHIFSGDGDDGDDGGDGGESG